MSSKIRLWSLRQSAAVGIHWKLERECSAENAAEWKALFSKDEPDVRFEISEKEPKAETRMPVPARPLQFFFPTEKREVYHFTVVGRGEFPSDMLRYDECWPVDGDAVRSIQGRYATNDDMDRREVRLGCVRRMGPTYKRWESFGWEVLPQALEQLEDASWASDKANAQ